MTKATPKPKTERQRWLPYVRQLADALALKDWVIEMSEDPPPTGAVAAVGAILGRKRGCVYLSDNHLHRDCPDEQRDSIVHELIHLHLSSFHRSVEQFRQYSAANDTLMEYAVDGLAAGISPLLPLPPKALHAR